MTPKKIEVINAVTNNIVPPEQQHLHILQMLLTLNPAPITSLSDEELLVQVQKLEQIESFCGFLPIWK